MFEKIKNSIRWILGVLGILFLFDLYRRFREDPTSIDPSDILDKIKEGEEKLKEIDKDNPAIQDILDRWNK